MPSVPLDLPSRVLISGAAGGIGGALGRKLIGAGTAIVGTDRSEAPDGWQGLWITADVATRAGHAAISDAITEPLDGAVFAAGILDPADWESIDPDDAARLLAVNLTAPFFILRALLPRMSEGASVVIVGSIAGLRGAPASPFYAASKAGLRNLAASLALLLQPRGIRVNVVAPGLIDTPLTSALNQTLASRRHLSVGEIEAERAAAIPLGRAGTSDEVADSCLYLLSRQSAYMTGSTLFSTGGVLAGMT